MKTRQFTKEERIAFYLMQINHAKKRVKALLFELEREAALPKTVRLRRERAR